MLRSYVTSATAKTLDHMDKLCLVPVELDEANYFVEQHHRHHGPVVGHKFSLAVAKGIEGDIVGVAIVGRPVSRVLDDWWTLEVTRLCTDGTKNVASMLYRAAWRATVALGYRKLITYVLCFEDGVSLRAAGFRCIGETKGRSWSCPSRPRIDKHPLQDKFRWELTQNNC